VWPHKVTGQFWLRLKTLGIGVARGIWLAIFPKKLRQSVVWEMQRIEGDHVSQKVS